MAQDESAVAIRRSPGWDAKKDAMGAHCPAARRPTKVPAMLVCWMARQCPMCKAPSASYPENRCAPFCSPRCKLSDLHGWLEGKYALPDDATSPPDPEWDHDDGDPVH